ncbi:MAG: TldD/PmbA family protein [Anaerolineae bacterium]
MTLDILARLRDRAEQAEVYTYTGESTLVSFEANAIKSAEVEEAKGIALRCVSDGRLGFAAAGGAFDADELLDTLLTSARYGDEVAVRFPSAAPAPEVTTFDPSLAETPVERLVEIGQEIVATLLAEDKNARISVDIERSVGRSVLRNSAGTDVTQEASGFSVDISVERVRGDDVLIVFDGVDDIGLSDSYREAVVRVAQKLRLARRSVRMRSGRMPVLFSPSGGEALLYPLMLGLDGQSVERGVSPLAGRVGETILDPRLSLWDDPTLAGRPESSRYDDEGVPCRRKPLIAQGVCTGFLFDLRTAALLGTHSTGNGARGLYTLPSPAPSNLVLEPGETPLAEIIAGIDYGLLVDDVLGIGQGNALSGAFSHALGLAYLIRDGEIVGRVKNVSIAGNVYEDLRRVEALSRESYWVQGSMHMPYVLVPELNVIGQGKRDRKRVEA